MRTSLTLLRVRGRQNGGRRDGETATSRLLPVPSFLWAVVLAEEVVDQVPTLQRLHENLALPWCVAGGAMAASSAAPSAVALPLYALIGGLNALLWQRAWRDGTHELERLGTTPALLAVLKNLSVLWLIAPSRSRPYLGLSTVPLAVYLITTRRTMTRAPYAQLAAAADSRSLGAAAPRPSVSQPLAAGSAQSARTAMAARRDIRGRAPWPAGPGLPCALDARGERLPPTGPLSTLHTFCKCYPPVPPAAGGSFCPNHQAMSGVSPTATRRRMRSSPRSTAEPARSFSRSTSPWASSRPWSR